MPKLKDRSSKNENPPQVVAARGSEESATCRGPGGARGDCTDPPAAVHRNVPLTAGLTWTARADAAIIKLGQLFPKCFFLPDSRRRPLKVGIDADVIAAAPAFDRVDLSIALKRYVNSHRYLDASRIGTPRIDLNGGAAGTVTEHEAAYAAERAARLMAAAAANAKTTKTTKTKTKTETKRATAEAPTPKRSSLADLKEVARLRKLGRAPR
jgi:sRNA-binding protein